MNIEEMVDHYRHDAERIADECAMRTGGTGELSRQNFMLGAWASVCRELLSEMDEPTRQRVAARLKAWRDYEERQHDLAA